MFIPENLPVETPFYLYDLGLLDRTLQLAKQEATRHGFFLHYAVKANNDEQIMRQISSAGLGADCVSGNEIIHAVTHGFDSHEIVFAGVGKSDREIENALRIGIGCFNVESREELEVIGEIAGSLRITAPVAIRINPDIEAHTHQHITTGLRENKFGISLQELPGMLHLCSRHTWLKFKGLHFHIGSQITSPEPFEQLCGLINHVWKAYEIDRFGGTLINLGGGLGIDYQQPVQNNIPDFRSYFELFSSRLDLPVHVERHFEPGRSLVGQCGALITRVLFVKKGETISHVIADAGMTELIRPALYGAYHRIDNLDSTGGCERYDVVGPVCESSDILGKSVILPETSRGDLLRIHSCGAYGESMAMNYNLRGKVAKYYFNSPSFFQSEYILDAMRFVTSSMYSGSSTEMSALHISPLSDLV